MVAKLRRLRPTGSSPRVARGAAPRYAAVSRALRRPKETLMQTHRSDLARQAVRNTLPNLAFALVAMLAASPLLAQTAVSPTRGQTLYATHCVACHDTQKHWREKRTVRDWDGLVSQVRQWQGTLRLQWSDADITEVARHLNDSFYQLPQSGVRQGRRPGVSREQG